MFHLRHKREGHRLRLLQGAGRGFEAEALTVASSLNDWLEGARRLTSEDVSQWQLRDDGRPLDAARGRCGPSVGAGAAEEEEEEEELQMV